MRLFVMTGDFMTGKTTWIERMLIATGLPLESSNPEVRKWQWERACGKSGSTVNITGVYTPAVFEGDAKVGIDAVLIPDCRRFPFAKRREGFTQQGRGCSMQPESGPLKLGWEFDDEALGRINRHLAAVDGNCCDLLVIDELGPMELMWGQGYTEGMALLDAAAVPAALLVIRPSLLDVARERWGELEVIGPDADAEEFLERVRAL